MAHALYRQVSTACLVTIKWTIKSDNNIKYELPVLLVDVADMVYNVAKITLITNFLVITTVEIVCNTKISVYLCGNPL